MARGDAHRNADPSGPGTGVVYDLQAYGFSPHGGIARIFDELFARINRPDSGWTAYLYLEHHLQRYPKTGDRVLFHPEGLSLHPLLRRFPVLRRGVDPLLRARRSRMNIRLFHPTFYPSHNAFSHLPAIVNVYDLVHETIEHADNMPDHQSYLTTKRRWIEKASRLICISEATRNEMLTHYQVDPSRVHVIHLACSPVFQEKSTVAKPAKPFLLFIGSRQRYKNFHRMVTAYGAWKSRHDVDLVVVGNRFQHEDRLILDLAGNPAGVRFTGPLTDDQLCDMYNQATGFLYPSLKEGFGIPLLESMSCRCPMLISDIPVFREVAGDQALYMDPTNTVDMIRGLDQLLSFNRSSWNEQARRECLARYSWEKCTQEILAVYQKALA